MDELVTPIRLLGQHLLDGVLKQGGDIIRVSSERGRTFTEDCMGGIHGRIPFKRIHPSEHLIEDYAEGEDVGPSVHCLTTDLLWGHIGDRS